MGVTIHFEGRLRGAPSLSQVVQIARAFAGERDWPCAPIAQSEVRLARVRDEQDWDYVGPTSGIELLPPGNADPVRLEFDRDNYVQEFTKTQFAGPKHHTEVVALLRALEPHFENLTVYDEGEYWDTGDLDTLAHHIESCNRALASYLAENPGSRGPVQLAGRWIDIYS